MASVQRRKYGWLVRWREPGDDGKPRMRSRFFKDEETARMFADRFNSLPAEHFRRSLALVGKTHLPGQALPLARYARSVLGPDLRDATRELYGYTITNHLEGTTIGATAVDAVTPAQVREFLNGLDAGPGARRNVHKLLARTFNAAIREGLIAASPLFRAGVRRPPHDGEVRPLTVGEVEALAAAAKPGRDRCVVLLLAYAGLRAGEVSGLRVSDVDFARCSLRVAQGAQRGPRGRPVIGPPKTRAARRTIGVACSVTEELSEYAASEGLSGEELLFRSSQRGILSPRVVHRIVSEAAGLAALGHVHPHQLRHTAASLWIDDGMNPRQVQAALGHANVRVTLELYAHLFGGESERLGESMERRRREWRDAGQRRTVGTDAR